MDPPFQSWNPVRALFCEKTGPAATPTPFSDATKSKKMIYCSNDKSVRNEQTWFSKHLLFVGSNDISPLYDSYLSTFVLASATEIRILKHRNDVFR